MPRKNPCQVVGRLWKINKKKEEVIDFLGNEFPEMKSESKIFFT